ncbi:MAG: T9SS type A sorting domain-containing protein [Bacteroidetes bacterium]|nr:T9SS type A sorting domain-containing protein [Bacteroidota bacterium]
MKKVNKFRLSFYLSLIIVITSSFPFILKSHNYPGLISEWVQLDSLPYTQEFHVTLGWQKHDTNYIITAGGRVNNITSVEVLMYNTNSNQYRFLNPLPIPLERAGGFILEDSIYIIGGSTNSGNNFSNQVFKLDLTSTAPWILKNNFPINIGEITNSTTALNDEFAYVAGGSNGTSALNNVFIYNAMIDSWFTASPLPGSGKYGGGLAAINDSTLLFVGGRNSSTVFSQTYKGEINNSNPTVIDWTTGPQYPSGEIYYPGSWGSKDGYAYFTGGSSSVIDDIESFRASNKTYRYNSSTGTFDTLSDKPTPVSHTQIFGFDSNPSPPPMIYKVYAPGGNSNGNAQRVHELLIVTDTSVSNIKLVSGTFPKEYILYQSYPNPFNPSTKIKYDLPKKGKVKLIIYDLLGREIKRLIKNELMPAGRHTEEFTGQHLASGVYFYRLEVDDGKEYLMTKKMVYVK